jgi:hypothetical protein
LWLPATAQTKGAGDFDTCSLDGTTGYVTTQQLTKTGCDTNWLHVALDAGATGHQFGFNCGGHDGHPYTGVAPACFCNKAPWDSDKLILPLAFYC